jgi:hypothetical protein
MRSCAIRSSGVSSLKTESAQRLSVLCIPWAKLPWQHRIMERHIKKLRIKDLVFMEFFLRTKELKIAFTGMKYYAFLLTSA